MSDKDCVKTTDIKTAQSDNGDVKDVSKIHSANAWEQADLGDDSRKNKFLRLMGAGKMTHAMWYPHPENKEHHGKIVIGDHLPAHARASTETDKVEHILEEQYQQSMTHRLTSGRRGHIGLGFHEDDKEAHHTESQTTPEGEAHKDQQDDQEEVNLDVKVRGIEESGSESENCSSQEESDERDGSSQEDSGESDSKKHEDTDKGASNRKRRSTDKYIQDTMDKKKMKFVKGSS